MSPSPALPPTLKAWQMVEPGRLVLNALPMPPLAPGEALVEVRGCGVCHTDLSYFYLGVPTVDKPPLTLGHEIAGVVVAAEDTALVGREVIVPALLPCRKCEICASGRGNRCLKQRMPGNSMGVYGGFASHIPVPATELCLVPDRRGIPLEHLAVVADAIATPYHAAQRAELMPGDLVVVVGAAGGVGSFMTQLAKGMGARAVIAIDVNAEKLKLMLEHGADFAIDPRGKSIKEIKETIKVWCKEQGLPANSGWKIFEASGSKPGQELALALLSFVGKLIIVGYGTDETSYMLSKLMAFEADVLGVWGCLPEDYPKVLQLCLDGKIALTPFVQTLPMSRIAEVFDDAHHGRLRKRAVLTPDF